MEELKIALDAIGLYQTQYEQVDKLWGYFSVVTLAVSGFVVASERATRTLKEPIVIISAYLVFCVGNNMALVAGQRQLEQTADIAITLAQKALLDISSFQPLPHEYVSNFHIAIVISVSIGVVAVAWLRKISYNKLSQHDTIAIPS